MKEKCSHVGCIFEDGNSRKLQNVVFICKDTKLFNPIKKMPQENYTPDFEAIADELIKEIPKNIAELAKGF